MAWVTPRSLIPLALFWTPGGELMPPVWLLLALNLGCLFAVGMGCHGELARQRPPTARLTEFYFFLSVGGVLGGVFNALVAPLIFSGLWEYPLVLLAACLMKPATPEDARRGLTWDILLSLALLGLVLLARSVLTAGIEGGHIPVLIATFGYFVPGVALFPATMALRTRRCRLPARHRGYRAGPHDRYRPQLFRHLPRQH
jgi:hypothetical protein